MLRQEYLTLGLGNVFFQPIISKELINEVNEVLKRPLLHSRIHLHNKNIRSVLGALFNRARNVNQKRIREGLFSDSKDHFLLEIAVSSGAKIIVTGDSGILHHIKYGDILFLTPEQFCKKLGF